MLVDTHCHLADPAFAPDREVVLLRAREAGVGHVVVVGENPERAEEAIALAREHSWLSATAGLHPHEASRWSPSLEETLARQLVDPVVVAAGEMGLDYHYEYSPRKAQRAAFDAQLALARTTGRPAVIHAREADDDVASALRAHPDTVAILHSFSSGLELLRTALALGHYISFSGMVTFRSWSLDEAIREVPSDRLLLETDAPFLAPVPHRGRRNEPTHVRQVAQRIAEVRQVPPADLLTQTGRNARAVFGPRLTSSREECP